jgi:hypothetical protein
VSPQHLAAFASSYLYSLRLRPAGQFRVLSDGEAAPCSGSSRKVSYRGDVRFFLVQGWKQLAFARGVRTTDVVMMSNFR